jgi:ferredoxin-NADP reductase
MIKKNVSDYKKRTFYLSGPFGLVNGFKKTLRDLGVPANKIKTDFFPGFA